MTTNVLERARNARAQTLASHYGRIQRAAKRVLGVPLDEFDGEWMFDRDPDRDSLVRFTVDDGALTLWGYIRAHDSREGRRRRGEFASGVEILHAQDCPKCGAPTQWRKIQSISDVARMVGRDHVSKTKCAVCDPAAHPAKAASS